MSTLGMARREYRGGNKGDAGETHDLFLASGSVAKAADSPWLPVFSCK